MKALIVADVHANLAAFEAVLRDAESRGPVEELWCLGDCVGYGPQPRECLALLRSGAYVAVAGNHDLAAIGALPAQDFNPAARAAVLWTGAQLGEEERRWLAALPETLVQADCTLVHGSLPGPVWDYLISQDAAAAHLALQQTAAGFVGHSHLPLVFRETPGTPKRSYLSDGSALSLGEERFVANPGSVGQPRDGDPRAAYAIADTDAGRVTFHRVEYDVAATQGLMRAAGLPESLVLRLAAGR